MPTCRNSSTFSKIMLGSLGNISFQQILWVLHFAMTQIYSSFQQKWNAMTQKYLSFQQKWNMMSTPGTWNNRKINEMPLYFSILKISPWRFWQGISPYELCTPLWWLQTKYGNMTSDQINKSFTNSTFNRNNTYSSHNI